MGSGRSGGGVDVGSVMVLFLTADLGGQHVTGAYECARGDRKCHAAPDPGRALGFTGVIMRIPGKQACDVRNNADGADPVRGRRRRGSQVFSQLQPLVLPQPSHT